MFSLIPIGQEIVKKPKDLPCLWYWGGLGKGNRRGNGREDNYKLVCA